MKEENLIDFEILVIRFINFLVLKLKFYYIKKVIVIYFVGMVIFKILILEGIFGIGKILLFYVMGKFFSYDFVIIFV